MNSTDNEFLEYLELQGNLDMITKSELLEEVRRRGGHISDRQLVSYVTEGVIPKSARIGSRSGAYPRIIADLLSWVSDARERGLSVDAIKELLPLWRYLQETFRRRELNLLEFEYRARQSVSSVEAAFAVPWLVHVCMPCPQHEVDELLDMKVIDKNGNSTRLGDNQLLTIGFVVADQDEDTGRVRRVAAMRTTLTVPLGNDEHEPSTVYLGVPNGVEVPAVDHEVPVTMGTAPGGEGRDAASTAT